MTPEQAFRAASTLDAAALRYCEGKFLDLTYQERVDITQEAYLEAVEGRWAALMGCAAELGAQMASAGEGAEQAMALYGRKLGARVPHPGRRHAYVGIGRRDDAACGRSAQQAQVLPIVYALRNATGAERRTWVTYTSSALWSLRTWTGFLRFWKGSVRGVCTGKGRRSVPGGHRGA